MTLIEIVALIIFLFPLAFSPGPGNMFFAANGARFGFAKTLSANFGYHLATIIVTFLIGFGFNIFFSFINDQYQYIQIIGSLYVIYLAYKFFKGSTYENNNQNLKCTFVDGVILLVFNPKAYVIISLMFTMSALGLLARTVPQMQVFQMSFPLSFFLGIIIYIALIPMYPEWTSMHFKANIDQINSLIRAMSMK